ncbi:hypothetical protein BH20ACI3_BH20ACI3_29980 [soil metagenome]
MKRKGLVLAIGFIVIIVVAAWLWRSRPQSSDMATYAPADSLVYLECNSLLDVLQGIANTDAWKELSPLLGTSAPQPPNRGLTRLISWTGLGPTRTVILSRAQLATVILDLGAKEKGETLTIKPEAAILIETHTAERRIRRTVEDALELFAEKAYHQLTFQRIDVGGSEFLVWSSATSERQIVATIDGTLVIVGNSERAVKTCLEVRRGQRPSLKGHPEMQRMRLHLAAANTLAFGFISSSNAARLFSLSAPLLFGRAPGDARFDQIIGTSASRLLAGVGWSSRVSSGGIEDHYLFSLQSTLVSRLQEHFRPTNTPIRVLEMLPREIHSVSVYRFENPVATWQLLETTLSSQLDALSAMLINSLLKSALTSYGIDDVERFLTLIGPELSTVRLTRESEQSTLVAWVRDEAALRKLLLGPGGNNIKPNFIGETELIEIPEKMIAVSFLKATVLIGPPRDLQLYLKATTGNRATPDRIKSLEHFSSRSNSASVVTYTRETDRVLNFLRAISRASGGATSAHEATELSSKIEQLPYSATETTLGAQGLERITRSSFGQFATLVPLLFPER